MLLPPRPRLRGAMGRLHFSHKPGDDGRRSWIAARPAKRPIHGYTRLFRMSDGFFAHASAMATSHSRHGNAPAAAAARQLLLMSRRTVRSSMPSEMVAELVAAYHGGHRTLSPITLEEPRTILCAGQLAAEGDGGAHDFDGWHRHSVLSYHRILRTMRASRLCSLSRRYA